MKTTIIALGILVLFGGQLAHASADQSTGVKTAKSATATTTTGEAIRIAGRMVTSGG
jgi:hypothetical protein